MKMSGGRWLWICQHNAANPELLSQLSASTVLATTTNLPLTAQPGAT
jgi:hypothetical protein